MKINTKTTRLELAAIITEALNEKGLSAVLVGGAVVSIYTNNRYQSMDLDFISPNDQGEIDTVMEALGFSKMGKNFKHPNTELFVEFPSGPIAIGNEMPIKPEGVLKVGRTKVILLSPTQCVMDRLAAFYHWNDTQSLEQAIMVSLDQDVNLDKIRRWSKKEGEEAKFERYISRLKFKK